MRPAAMCVFAAAYLMLGCEALDSLTGDGGVFDRAGECSPICQKVSSCGAEVTPPTAVWFGYSEGGSGSDGVDCAVNCIDTINAVRHGYSDCQMECLAAAGTGCGEMNNCWKSNTDLYKQYCVTTEPAPIEPEPVPEGEEPPVIDNDTDTGSEIADEVTEDPAVNEAINDTDYPVYIGNEPPIIAGLYHAVGTIDQSQNAREVGAGIDTQICFWGQEELITAEGTEVYYCEFGVEGQDSAPITGSGSQFTIYLNDYPGATIMFSGTINEDQSVPSAEALVTYTMGTGIWEHSVTQWTRVGDCGGCGG